MPEVGVRAQPQAYTPQTQQSQQQQTPAVTQPEASSEQ